MGLRECAPVSDTLVHGSAHQNAPSTSTHLHTPCLMRAAPTPIRVPRVDFPAKEVPYARVRPANSLEPSAGPFVDETTMRKDYPGWGLAKPATPVRAMSVPRTAGPFEGTSMYKDDFRKWPGARPAPAAPLLGSNAALPRGAFDDATTHRTAYTPKQTGPAERFRPEDNTLKPEGWYDGVPSTEYRRHYFEKDGRPQPRAGATTGASGAVVPKGPFMGDTTYGGDFRARTAPPYQKAQRPVGEGMNSGPFYGGTTYGDSFVKKVGWGCGRVRAIALAGQGFGNVAVFASGVAET